MNRRVLIAALSRPDSKRLHAVEVGERPAIFITDRAVCGVKLREAVCTWRSTAYKNTSFYECPDCKRVLDRTKAMKEESST